MEHFTPPTPLVKGDVVREKNYPRVLNTADVVIFSKHTETEYSECLWKGNIGLGLLGLRGSGDDDTQILTH